MTSAVDKGEDVGIRGDEKQVVCCVVCVFSRGERKGRKLTLAKEKSKGRSALKSAGLLTLLGQKDVRS